MIDRNHDANGSPVEDSTPASPAPAPCNECGVSHRPGENTLCPTNYTQPLSDESLHQIFDMGVAYIAEIRAMACELREARALLRDFAGNLPRTEPDRFGCDHYCTACGEAPQRPHGGSCAWPRLDAYLAKLEGEKP